MKKSSHTNIIEDDDEEDYSIEPLTKAIINANFNAYDSENK